VYCTRADGKTTDQHKNSTWFVSSVWLNSSVYAVFSQIFQLVVPWHVNDRCRYSSFQVNWAIAHDIFGDLFKKITLKALISCVGVKRRLLHLRKVSEKFLISYFIAVTIHIPLPKSHTNHYSSEAPAAIAHEAPEGTYLLPVTEHKDSPPAINLAVNLRLLLEKGLFKQQHTKIIFSWYS